MDNMNRADLMKRLADTHGEIKCATCGGQLGARGQCLTRHGTMKGAKGAAHRAEARLEMAARRDSAALDMAVYGPLPRGAHRHLGRIVWPVPDSADTVRCPFCGQERRA